MIVKILCCLHKAHSDREKCEQIFLLDRMNEKQKFQQQQKKREPNVSMKQKHYYLDHKKKSYLPKMGKPVRWTYKF